MYFGILGLHTYIFIFKIPQVVLHEHVEPAFDLTNHKLVIENQYLRDFILVHFLWAKCFLFGCGESGGRGGGGKSLTGLYTTLNKLINA